MRKGRRSIRIAIAPAEWRISCRLQRHDKANVKPAPLRARLFAHRGWPFELDELIGAGYVPHYKGGHYNRADIERARHTRCRCGEDMDFRGFELRESRGERIAYRCYAVCSACWWWFEF
jgi:hypothetical protein